MKTEMDAALFTGKEITKQSISSPVIGKGEVLIKVLHAGLCGTDLAIYLGKMAHRIKPPLVMGHEFCGVIVEKDPSLSINIGQKVIIQPMLGCGTCPLCMKGETQVCLSSRVIGIEQNGGFAEYAVAPIEAVYPVPQEMPSDEAALMEPVAVAVRGVKQANVAQGDVVVVLGGGPIGLLLAMAARQAGAEKVYVSEINDYRLKVANDLGFLTIDAKQRDVEEAILADTNEFGADVVFEAAGTVHTAKQMTRIIKRQGTILVISLYKEPAPVDLLAMQNRELTIKSTRAYTHQDFKEAIELVAQKQFDLAPLITDRLPLEQLAEGFQRMQVSPTTLKVQIEF